MTTLFLFIGISALLAVISRKSLLNPHCHGFYRFLAWECILILLLHNYEFWFFNMFSLHQILSWIFLVLSIVMAVSGAVLLHTRGRTTLLRKDDTLLSFEKTTQLVTTGLYRYIRHPLYNSLLLLAWGLFCKQPVWWPGLPLVTGATLALVFTAKMEERINLDYFGRSYADYMMHTKMFTPFLF